MILQGKPSVFETDLYFPIVERAADLAGVRYRKSAKRRPVTARHRRPYSSRHISRQRWRAARQRGPQLRSAARATTRDSPRATARP